MWPNPQVDFLYISNKSNGIGLAWLDMTKLQQNDILEDSYFLGNRLFLKFCHLIFLKKNIKTELLRYLIYHSNFYVRQ